MKKITLLFSLLITVFAVQGQISWQNPNLTGERMNALQFVSPSTGWVAGDAGTLLKTSDSGTSWSKINLGICNNVIDLHFVSANEGWMIAGNSLYHSLNGGTNWSLFPVLSYNIISAMNFVSSSIWFLSCEDGLLATLDGGATWELRNAAISSTFAFANQRKGWQTAPFGGIKYTTDGGVTWTTQTSGVSENILDICILDSNEVWMSGVSGLIHTTNAGGNWTVNTSSRTVVGSVLIFTPDCHFINSNLGWAVSSVYECIIVTTDGGVSWTKKPVVGNKVFALDATNGYVIGDHLLQTTNGGNSFTNELDPVTESDLYSVSFSDNLHGISVGAGGIMLRTTNGGGQWVAGSVGTTSDLNDLFVSGNTETWIVGNMPDSILHTADGGMSWQKQTTGSNESLMSVHFVDNQIGWAVGTGGTILHTTNGGEAWSNQASNTSTNLQAVFFVDATHGWVVGELGLILRSVDGGSTWDAVNSGFNGLLADVHFVSETIGWAVGETTTILHTTDGGLSWTPQPVDMQGDLFNLFAVHFVNAQVGWTNGFTPSIYHTVDGGNTWLPLSCAPEIRSMYDLFISDDTHAWVVGERGAVVFSSDVTGELSVADFTNENESIQVSPNPAFDVITIHSDAPLKNVEIRDLNGRVVKKVTGTSELSIMELQSGMYYLYATSESATVLTAKFFKY